VGLAPEAVDWRPLLFQQFHDILPGTAIPEVYDQAESQWRAARRRARRQRDRALAACAAPDARHPDGALTPPRIAAVQLRGLVVLAACHAARGPLRMGDDDVAESLAGAFLGAGADAVTLEVRMRGKGVVPDVREVLATVDEIDPEEVQ
jgi:hypothetical protein